MARHNLTRVFLLALTGALGLWLAWPSISVTPLIFLGFVPFLLIEELFYQDKSASGRLYLGVTYTGLLLWNTFTTYWVMKATVGGGLMAIIANSALMTLPFAAFHGCRSRLRWPWALAFSILVVSWLSLELLHLNWQLAWPWLNLGNSFASRPDWIQWYEYTGALGGTLWIWLVNGLLFLLINGWFRKRQLPWNTGLRGVATGLGLVLFVPLVWSAAIPTTTEGDGKVQAVAVQPNVDPYEDKFRKEAYDQQLASLMNLSKSAMTDETDLILWPETSLPGNYRESRFLNQSRAKAVYQFVDSHASLSLLTGLNSYVTYQEPATPTARNNNGRYYDVFNAAVALDGSRGPVFYHKSKLVPGVERMPYPSVFGFLENLAIEMGGTSGSLGSQEEASVMQLEEHLTVAPVICYESIFGDYVGDYVQKGANLITIVTNDGWWGDTDGYRQHFTYSVLRAIEMRKSIARSANTGISGFILPDGEVIQRTPYWEKAAIQETLPLNSEVTFYARYGDYLGYLAVGLMVLGTGVALLQRFRIISRF